jgi:hypothetical protein
MDDAELSNQERRIAMAMLTATTSQEVCFQRLGVRIQVKLDRQHGSKVRVTVENDFFNAGFDPSRWTDTTSQQLSQELIGESRHRICNQLQVAAMSLEILQSRSEDGSDDLAPILEMAIQSLTELERQAVDEKQPV